MGLIVSVLIVLIIVGLIYWAFHKIAAAFGLPAQIVVLIDVAIVVIVVLWLVSTLFGSGRINLNLP